MSKGRVVQWKLQAWSSKLKVEVEWLNPEVFEQDPKRVAKELKLLDGVLVPGGFGSRGIEGKMLAIRYAREQGIPYLGLCYGLQLATIEYARHMLGYKQANTTEIDPATPEPIIHLINEQEERMKNKEYGGTMRLGTYKCVLRKGSLARKLYGQDMIEERHRHRYECNPAYRAELEKAGLIPSGLSPDGTLVEVVELKDHPFFIACQFHPEFLSRPFRPHPLFVGLIEAASKKK
jgi:CTP synthase